jgi:hypothetical protein
MDGMKLWSLAAALLLGNLAMDRADSPGSVGERHWAFQSVYRPAVPTVRDGAWIRTPIDAFVLARLERLGIRPCPPAEKRTLLRRVYFDLIGLPPTPAEQQAFLDDSSPDAFARVVDDLLSRPQYGERWARHWFDVVRYAESNGYEHDGVKPNAWRYRDYVIEAFNADKPYDQFLTEQLAGDEVDGADVQTQIATTFLRLGTWDAEPADSLIDRYDQLDDVLGTTVTAFLGLTLRCARCHDHKFEPFPQTDYYRMLAVFEPLKRPFAGRTDLDREIATAGTGQEKPPRAYIWYEDGAKAPPTHVFQRGNPARPKQEVTAGLPAVLVREEPQPPKPLARSTGRRLWLAKWMTQPDNPLVARVMVNRIWQWHFGKGLVATSNDFGTAGEPPTHPELLDWLASELVAGGWKLKPLHRLILLSNAYQMSSAHRPEGRRTDPKAQLIQSWSPRRLEAEAIRDATLSVSDQLNPQLRGKSVFPPIPRAVLEGQSRPGSGWKPSEPFQANRRSVYIFAKRSIALPELELLDTPDTTSSCEQRLVSTNGPQALTFLNGEFINEQARFFAARLEREAGASAPEQIRRAFVLALCRSPRLEELHAGVEFLAKHKQEIEADARLAGAEPGNSARKALEAFCLVLLNTNEFVYLD